MPTKIAILGDGAMGTACALVLASKPDQTISLWSARQENGRILQHSRENKRFLPGIPIPESIELTTDVTQAIQNCALLVLATPTVYMRETLAGVSKPLKQNHAPVVSVAKGIERSTFLRPTEIVEEIIGPRGLAVLSGPSHAEEIAQGKPASLVVASQNLELARWIQSMFNTDRFRVYTNADLVGVEQAGALKNIIGIAAGINDGLGFGDNSKSALLTRGLVEMTRFGVAHGAERATFFGLAGMGDLITTCISPHGRNRRVGEMLGKGQKLQEILAVMQQVAEGVYTTRSVHEKAAQMGLDMPITDEVYRVLYENKDPLLAVQDLMTREPKGE